MIDAHLTIASIFSITVLIIMYGFLMAEKVNKVIVTGIAACLLIFAQIFKLGVTSSQTVAFDFVARNLDVLGFIIGMMVLVGIVKESGIFEVIAIWMVKKVKGNPKMLLAVFGYLALFMTAFLSNIPTVLILTPVLLVLIKELKLPYLPYFIVLITMANIGGAMTPISDPTTYYEAKTAGLSFIEVITNSGLIVIAASIVTTIYTQLVFRKQLEAVKVKTKEIAAYRPLSALKDKKILYLGTPLLLVAILTMIGKEMIAHITGVSLDNATITLAGALIAMLLFNKDVKEVFHNIIDWEIIFFFMGLFIVVGSLEHTEVVKALAGLLLKLSGGNLNSLQALLTYGSSILSIFIDNVPYNITMVSAIQAMAKVGLYVYPLWWGLNVGTSIGGAGSPIGAACNVVALGQAEKEGVHIKFLKFLMIGFPLVILNATTAFIILWLKYGR